MSGSVRAAGGKLGVSHSTVSRRVEALEDKLATKLFDRHRDGLLLTARGNPFENVVRDGDEIVVHSAAGKDLRMKPLKTLIDEGEERWSLGRVLGQALAACMLILCLLEAWATLVGPL